MAATRNTDVDERTPRVVPPTARRSMVFVMVLCAAWMVQAVLASAAFAGPPAPHIILLEQPSGHEVQALAYGDAFHNGFETVDGYTIIQNPLTGTWFYAALDSRQQLTAGSTAAHLAPPADATPHLRGSPLPPDSLHPSTTVIAEGDLANTSAGNNLGTQHSLVILVSFTNVSPQTQPSQWQQRYFGATDSVADYYNEVSYGNLTIAPAAENSGPSDGVIGWIPLSRPHPGDADNLKQTVAAEAITAASPWINYASFDTNNDGSVQSDELHVTVILAGGESSFDPAATCGPGVWGHQWAIGTNGVANDGVRIGGFLADGGYTMFGERHCIQQGGTSINRMATLGIMVHEIGHDLGMPDLYDTDSGDDPAAPKSNGVGTWSVMGAGSWLGTPAGSRPPHPDAYLKYYQGWITPQVITGTQTGVGVRAASQFGDAVLLLSNPGGVDWRFGQQSGTGEFFLVENRQATGYDSALPACGLLVWHIDESAPFGGSANANEQGVRLVELMQADGLDELGARRTGADPSDAGDPYPGSTGNTEFSTATNPNNRLNTGAFSGAGMQVQSTGCATTMTADFTSTGFDGGGGGGGGGGTGVTTDNFADAISLTVPLAVEISTAAATTEPGEIVNPGVCNMGGGNVGATVWYRVQLPQTEVLRVDTLGSNFDTVLAIYRSVGNGLDAVACNDDVDANQNVRTSGLSFAASAGVTYFIQAGGWGTTSQTAATGDLILSAAIQPPNDNWVDAQQIQVGARWQGNTSGASMESTEQRQPSFCNLGTAQVGRSVWYRFDASSNQRLTVDTGGTSYDSILAVYRHDLANNVLDAIGCNDDLFLGQARTSSVTFDAVNGSTYYFQVAGWTEPTGYPFAGAYRLQLSTVAPNDNYGQARTIAVGGSVQTTSRGATIESWEQLPSCSTRAGASVWLAFTAPATGTIAFTTLGSDYDTVVAAYRVNPANGNLGELDCNDDSGNEGDLTSRVDFNVTAGTDYRIVVLGYNGASGSLRANLSDIAGAAPSTPPVGDAGVRTAVQNDGRVVAVVRDQANTVWFRTQTNPGVNTWTNWQSLGGCAQKVAIARGPGGAMTVAAIGCSNSGGSAVFVRRQNSAGSTSWTPWQSIGGCAEQIDLHRNGNGRLTVAAIGCGSGNVFTKMQNSSNGNSWGSWLGLGGCAEAIDLDNQTNDKLVVAAIGCGSRALFIRTQTQANANGWEPWVGLGGCLEAIAMAPAESGRLSVAAIGCGSRSVFVKTQNTTNGAAWSGWANLGGCARQIDLGSGINGKLSVAAIGCGGNTVFTRVQANSGSANWNAWVSQGGCAQHVSFTVKSNNKLVLAAIGCGGNSLFTRIETQAGSNAYGGWLALGGRLQYS